MLRKYKNKQMRNLIEMLKIKLLLNREETQTKKNFWMTKVTLRVCLQS